VHALQERHERELGCVGYYADENGQVRNKLNHRIITANGGKHMCCKGTIPITRTFPGAYRMLRQISPLQPSFHPIRCDYEWPAAVYHIAEHAIEAFHLMVMTKNGPYCMICS
jgi:hypothetical protein